LTRKEKKGKEKKIIGTGENFPFFFCALKWTKERGSIFATQRKTAKVIFEFNIKLDA
jgi:hypothetical protein